MSKKIAKQTTKSAAKKIAGRVIRIVQVESGALVRVTKQGVITDSRLAERYGITKPFKSWTEVAADSWAKATAAYRAGKGTKGTIAAKAA
jgi:hypothetical protein